MKEDQVSSFPLSYSREPATGTSGNVMGVPQEPLLAGAAPPEERVSRLPSGDCKLTSAALVQGPRLPASDRAVSRT